MVKTIKSILGRIKSSLMEAGEDYREYKKTGNMHWLESAEGLSLKTRSLFFGAFTENEQNKHGALKKRLNSLYDKIWVEKEE